MNVYVVRHDDQEYQEPIAVFTDEATADHFSRVLHPGSVVESFPLNPITEDHINVMAREEEQRRYEYRQQQEGERQERRERMAEPGYQPTFADMLTESHDRLNNMLVTSLRVSAQLTAERYIQWVQSEPGPYRYNVKDETP